MRLQDLAIITGTPVDTDKALLDKFKAHDRVIHDPKTDLYSYRVRTPPSSPATHRVLRMRASSMTTTCEIRPRS